MRGRIGGAVTRVGNSVAAYADWFALECRGACTSATPRENRGHPHALLLVEQFPPSESGGVYRPASFARYASESGWSITVMVSRDPLQSGPLGQALRAQVPADIDVRELGIVERPLSWNLGPHVDGGLFRATDLVRRALPHAQGRIDAIIASGPSFHVFVAGFFLKQLTGARLILDYRDEWSECPFDFVTAGRLDRWWERRCLRASDSAAFTTAAMLEHTARTFPGAATQSVVIPNGFDFALLAEDTHHQRADLPDARRRARITFVGALGSHNDPASFLHTLTAVLNRRPDLVDAVQFCWLGHRSATAALQLSRFAYPDMFTVVPPVTPADAVEWMERSAMVLLIASPEWSRYRQGKLYAYLASSAPILAYATTGEMAALITDLDAGTIVPNADDRALEAALDLAVHRRLVRHRNDTRERWIRNHDRRVIARQLFAHLDQVIAGNVSGP